ncbi:hypothetical protein BDQ17DRAFT_485532 [Cyathus striatus]|nr:hypothetical protein BDQ17DRAFT_485532 [Cyathus striatus]
MHSSGGSLPSVHSDPVVTCDNAGINMAPTKLEPHHFPLRIPKQRSPLLPIVNTDHPSSEALIPGKKRKGENALVPSTVTYGLWSFTKKQNTPPASVDTALSSQCPIALLLHCTQNTNVAANAPRCAPVPVDTPSSSQWPISPLPHCARDKTATVNAPRCATSGFTIHIPALPPNPGTSVLVDKDEESSFTVASSLVGYQGTISSNSLYYPVQATIKHQATNGNLQVFLCQYPLQRRR